MTGVYKVDADEHSSHLIVEEILARRGSTNNISEQIKQKKIAILHENLSTSMPANVICAAIIYFGSYASVNDPMVFYWFIATLVVAFFRVISPLFYKSRIQSYHIQNVLFIIGVILTAMLWGIIDSVLLPHNNIVQQMIIIVIAAGITAGGIQTLQPSFLASALSICFIMTPLCIWAVMQATMEHQILALALTTYFLFMLVIAYRGDKVITQILKMHFENLALAEELAITNTKLQEYTIATESSEKMLRNILENAPIGMALLSTNERYIQTNHALEEIIGYSQIELNYLKASEIIFPDDLAMDIEERTRLIEGKHTATQVEKRYIHKNGQIIWVLTNTSLMRDMKGEAQCFIIQILDISERKQHESQMLELNKRTASTLDELKQRDSEMNSIKKMNDMLQICQDSTEAYSVIAITAQNLFPSFSGGFVIYDSNNLTMRTVQQWGDTKNLKSTFNLEDCWALRSGSAYTVTDAQKDLICHHFETQPTGSFLCMPLISHMGITGMLYLNSPEGIVITNNQKQLATTVSEIARLFLANIQLRESLQDLSIHDALTGLYNRRYLDETLTREIRLSVRQSEPLCLAMLDIDFFKNFNDTNGHEAGDEVLRHIGNILKETFRGSDFACRFGGEEFVIILINSNIKGAVDRMRHLCEKIKNSHLSFHGVPLPTITISVGLAEAPKHGTTAEALMQAVDEALYNAKNIGRDSIAIYKNKAAGAIT